MEILKNELLSKLRSVTPDPGESKTFEIPFTDGKSRKATLKREEKPSRLLSIHVSEESPSYQKNPYAQLEFYIKCGTEMLSAAIVYYSEGLEYEKEDGTLERTWSGSTKDSYTDFVTGKELKPLSDKYQEYPYSEALEELEVVLDEIKSKYPNLDKSPEERGRGG